MMILICIVNMQKKIEQNYKFKNANRNELKFISNNLKCNFRNQ